jgi:hypothetical protein
MPTSSRPQRLFDRYGHNPNHSIKTCDTPGCSREAKEISGQCWRCGNQKRRYGHPLQICPLDSEIDPLILRAERQRARHKHLDLDTLETHYRAVIDACRGKATPSFKEHGKLTFQIHDREASPVVRDISEGLDFISCLDLLTALCLMRITRPYAFKEAGRDGDEAFLAVVLEVFRKRAGVGLKHAPLRPGATRQTGYRAALLLPTRLAAARYLMMAIGGAAQALATREAKQEENDRETRAAYYGAIHAIEASA